MSAAAPPHRGDEHLGETSRETLLESREERTSGWTHYCCHAVRLLLLSSHGVCILAVSSSLDRLDQASWWLIFLPVWLGDALCVLLIVAAWFASCPYIRLCMMERQPRVGNHPSILTEVLPEIFLAVLGFLFLILAFTGEYFLCAYLDSEQRGEPRSLPAAATLLSLVALLAACHGALFTHSSPLYLLGGGSLFLTVVLFAATRQASPGARAAAVVPAALAAAGLAAAALLRLKGFLHVLNREERILRLLEAALLVLLALAAALLAAKIGQGRLAEAGAEGFCIGLFICLAAALRARLCCWEARRGTLEERRIAQTATSAETAREVQISSMHISTATSAMHLSVATSAPSEPSEP